MSEKDSREKKKSKNKKWSPQNRPGKFSWTRALLWLLLIALIYNWYMASGDGFGQTAEIEYTKFKQQLSQGNVERIHVQGDQIQGEFKSQQVLEISGQDTLRAEKFYTYIPSYGDDQLSAALEENDVTVSAEPESEYNWWYIALIILPILLFIYFGIMFYQRMRSQGQGFFNIGKSKAKLQEPEKHYWHGQLLEKPMFLFSLLQALILWKCL